MRLYFFIVNEKQIIHTLQQQKLKIKTDYITTIIQYEYNIINMKFLHFDTFLNTIMCQPLLHYNRNYMYTCRPSAGR